MNDFDLVKNEIMTQVIRAEDHRIRPHEVEKSVAEKMGVSRYVVTQAVNDLVEEGDLVFAYRDPCHYVEVPPIQLHHAARPMEVVTDADGNSWICDAGVEPNAVGTGEQCWRCDELAFTRID